MLSDHELLQADRQSRIDALDVDRSLIVQAPAGSGKTELLIQRYLKLLGIVNVPEEILAITFTRKAAIEMQNRVVNALRLARDGTEPQADYQRITHQAATFALDRDNELDWNLIQSPGRMRIQTVDAFGAGIARAVPLSSGLGGIGATVTGAEMTNLYHMAAAATLDSLDRQDEFGDAVERVLTHLDNHTGLYVSHLASMLAYREQWLELTGGGLSETQNASAVRRRLEKNIENIVVRHLSRVCDLMPESAVPEMSMLIGYAVENLRDSDDPDHPLCVLAGMQALPGNAAGDRIAWQAIAGLLLTKAGEWRRSINRNDGFPARDSGQKQRLYDLVDRLRNVPAVHDSLIRTRLLPAAQYVDEQWAVLLALMRLLPLAVVELQRLFGERGVCDHIQIALAADSALGTVNEPGDIALMLDYSIRHLLIDEMQDTSIGQHELLQKLTAGWTYGDGRTLFCVGDPMQSIYRFRDAEVGQFLLARRNGIGDVKLDSLIIRKNFRSGEHLVHWFNTIFSQIFPLQDDVSRGAISYTESVPAAAHANAGEYRIHPLFGASPEQEAQHTLSVVSTCLQENAADSVAVLVRSRTNLPALLYELRLAKIPFQALEIDRLTNLPEIIDLVALTRALCHEADRLAWLALLRGPWVGLTWADIHSLVRNDHRSTVVELLDDPNRMAGLSADAVNRLNDFRTRIDVHRLARATMALRDRVEIAWYALGGPCMLRDTEQIDNVYRFLDVIENIEFAGSLRDIRDLERVLDQERVSSKAGPDCRFQIMTMHKAKGLQFDHVVLHGLGRVARNSDKAVLSWTSDPGSFASAEMIISPIGPRSEIENDPLHQFIDSTESDKERLELDRLLYVSCTRARKSLHLIGSVGLTADRQSYRRPAARSLLYRLWPAIEPTYERAFMEQDLADTSERDDDVDSHLITPPLRRLIAVPPCNAPELPATPRAATEAGDAERTTVSYEWVGSTARHVGTIVHRWLQRITDGNTQFSSADVADCRPTSRLWARKFGVSDEDIEVICDRVADALLKISSDDKGRWLLSGDGETEFAVSGVVDGRVQSVVIDRIRIDDNGVHWVVDYKTGTHEGGNLAGFLAQEGERHRPQLTKYAALYRNLIDVPVRTALYFPLLQAFREIEIRG